MGTPIKQFSVEYNVSRIIYQNLSDGFTVAVIKKVVFDEGCEQTLSNYIVRGIYQNINPGDRFRSICTWVDDKKYGKQLHAISSIIVIPSNIRGIKRFLRKYVKGVGRRTVDALVKEYGTATLPKIRESLENVTAVDGIGFVKASKIRNTVLKHSQIEELSIYLFSKGVTNYNEIISIYETLGAESIDRIKSNPYVLCDVISVNKLPLADKIASQSDIFFDSPIRISKCILFYLTQQAYSNGHVYIPRNVLFADLSNFLSRNEVFHTNFSNEAICDALELLTQTTMLIEENNCLYLPSLYHVEQKIVTSIHQLTTLYREINQSDLMQFFNNYSSEYGIELDELQKLAVYNAYQYRFSIVTGGPGTGKTQTINTIVQYLTYDNPYVKIALVAPTGRAAKRMSEVSNCQSSTIHRLLGIVQDESFSIQTHYELDADYIICDEGSMVDLSLFNRLLDAVISSNASLVLVGDKNQLPSVGPGSVFRDLVDSQFVPTTVLNHLFRQENQSQINLNARRILDGVSNTPEQQLSFDVSKQDCFFFEVAEPEKIHAYLLRSIDKLMSLGTNISDMIVLSPMRKTAVGVISLNELIREHVNPADPSKAEIRNSLYLLREGDRVMQIKNNYELGVFNGDIGIIDKIDKENEEITVLYEDESSLGNNNQIVVYESRNLSELELAYAITVHKAQGCEYPCVFMPIHPSLTNLSKDIVYTALTRAKQRFVFIGQSHVLYSAIQKTSLSRYSGLKNKLLK